jgi:uncharacterized protein (TIGR03067 family)
MKWPGLVILALLAASGFRVNHGPEALATDAKALSRTDANKEDLARMQGDWGALSTIRDGEKVPDDEAQAIFRTVQGNQYTVYIFKKPLSKGSFTIDATKEPKTIDAYPGATPDKTKPLLGIYELNGDTYKVCFALPGKGRPTDFASKPGSGHTLTIWVREK